MNETAAPRPALVGWLGYGGLIPFATLAALTCLDAERRLFWGDALAAYGAVILSFVGALHWAFAMTLAGLGTARRAAFFVWSVIPSLIAWLALLLHSAWSDVLLSAGFILHYAQDRRLAALGPLPAWYLPLRLRLSIVAVFCLSVSAVVVS
jgi:uncharacterized membrane protein